MRVWLLPFSVPVLRAHVVPDSLAPAPQFLVWCCVERRGALGCWELGAVVDGVVLGSMFGCCCCTFCARVCLLYCAPHCRVALVLTFLLLAP